MHDLTQGSIPRHIVRLAIPMAIGMIFQTLYYLVDLYFVGRLGDAAIAGVSAAGNLQFIVLALTQVLGIGTMVLIAHAAGRKDKADATLVFNQSLSIAAIAAVVVLVAGYVGGEAYLRTIAADEETVANGTAYLRWFLPAMGMQFALVSMGSALRGTGIAKPTMIVQMVTVAINAVLAPVFIAGWLTGRPMGVAGAGLASSIAVGSGVLMLLVYFVRLEHFVAFERALFAPRWSVWGRLLRIGVPAGGEFFIMFVSMGTTYWLVRDFGAAAQAGYGVGSRVMQAIFLPAMAIAFAAAPVAAQNVGAGSATRARETFWAAAKIGSALMIVLTLVCQVRPEWFVHWFSADPAVVTIAGEFLQIIAWNFVAAGIVFTCSGMFQAMGNTIPSVVSSTVRFTIWVVPSLWLSTLPGFSLRQLWLVSVAASTVHAFFALWLLRRESGRRLPALQSVPAS